MPRTILNYKELLKSLLPIGKLWNKEQNTTIDDIMYSFAKELTRVEQRMEDLQSEAIIDTTDELLSDHERDFGLPDEFTDSSVTEDERRSIVKAKLLATGRCDKGYFIDIATTLGFDIIIIEFNAARCGLATCGDPCGSIENTFYWATAIEYSNADTEFAIVGDFVAGDYLARIPLMTNLIGMFNKYKPAQTLDMYTLYGGDFDSAFGPDYNSLPDKGEVLFKYWGQSFSRAFNSNFAIDRSVDLTDYFQGSMDRSFSNAFSVFYYASS